MATQIRYEFYLLRGIRSPEGSAVIYGPVCLSGVVSASAAPLESGAQISAPPEEGPLALRLINKGAKDCYVRIAVDPVIASQESAPSGGTIEVAAGADIAPIWVPPGAKLNVVEAI